MQFEMEELLEQANEVQETLSRSYAVPDEIDEADLEAGAIFSTSFLLVLVLINTGQNWKRSSWKKKKKGRHTSRISTGRQISSTKLPSKPARFALEISRPICCSLLGRSQLTQATPEAIKTT
jgi:hypothetical protein